MALARTACTLLEIGVRKLVNDDKYRMLMLRSADVIRKSSVRQR